MLIINNLLNLILSIKNKINYSLNCIQYYFYGKINIDYF